jgi:hypothetical protein
VTWSNGAGHTIHGTSGSFAASLVNRGTIAADWSGQELRLYAQEPGITNEGLIRVDAGCTLRLFAADLFTQSAGETRVEGSLELSGGPLGLAGGRLAGGGTVHGSVSSSGGTVSPGSSVGTLTVDGDYSQGAGGQLLVELAGTGVGQHDVLEVDGAASLGGTLYVTAAGGYQPQPGDSFTILEADLRSGEFDHVASWADSDCSLGFDVTYNAGTVVITAVDGAASVFCSNLESGDTSDWSNALP